MPARSFTLRAFFMSMMMAAKKSSKTTRRAAPLRRQKATGTKRLPRRPHRVNAPLEPKPTSV